MGHECVRVEQMFGAFPPVPSDLTEDGVCLELFPWAKWHLDGV